MKTNAILGAIIIYSPKTKELADFYQRGLQLKDLKMHGDDHLGFQISKQLYLGFGKVDADQSLSHGAVSLWFRVDDIQVTFDRFAQMGAIVRYPPIKKAMGEVLASVFDPEGNIIGLAQRKTVRQ